MAAGKARRGSASNVGRGGRKVAGGEAEGVARPLPDIIFRYQPVYPLALIRVGDRIRVGKWNGREFQPLSGIDSNDPPLFKDDTALYQEALDAVWQDTMVNGTGVVKIKDGVARRISPSRFRRRVHPRNRAKGKQRP